MKRLAIASAAVSLTLALTPALAAAPTPAAPVAPANAAALAARSLRPVSDFQNIADREQRAVELFREMGKVLQHPRCVNCHPVGERPLQGDAMRLHEPLVVRGPDGHGHATGLRCDTCHQAQNFDPASVPGNPKWGLAPAVMAWEGKALGEICRQIKDPQRNDHKTMDALVKHMAEDILVGWGWTPGPGRTPAPGTWQQFGELVKAWAASGAGCPA